MKKLWLLAVIPVVGIVFLVTIFIAKFLWAWTVPDLFPGAVAQGLVARDISWLTALKLAIVVAVITGGISHSQAQK